MKVIRYFWRRLNEPASLDCCVGSMVTFFTCGHVASGSILLIAILVLGVRDELRAD